jgi:hypothetical protein
LPIIGFAPQLLAIIGNYWQLLAIIAIIGLQKRFAIIGYYCTMFKH